jgi:hypothetical protein
MSASSKKARRTQRGHYRAATSARAATPLDLDPIAPSAPAPEPDDGDSTRPVAAVAVDDTPPSASASRSAARANTPPAEPPTIILTHDQVALLQQARPPHVTLPSPDDEGYAYGVEDERPEADAPTIVLDVAALLAEPPPARSVRGPIPPSPLAPRPRPAAVFDHSDDAYGYPDASYGRAAASYGSSDDAYARPDDSYGYADDRYGRYDPADSASDAASAAPDESLPRSPAVSFPRPLPPVSQTPTRRRDASATPTTKRAAPTGPLEDRDAELARLRSQRLERESQLPAPTTGTPFTDKLRQWWRDIRPGLDRVLGRSHHAGSRGARATSFQTSAQLPAVRVRSVTDGEAPAIERRSPTARSIGERAQTAALPALAKLHTRAEHMAQQLVNRIDEHLGDHPPMQHVILGPGRMIVSFAATVTIRDAQTIIASVQARSLRRLVGYNAYLVLVPPGREARYAGRLHAYRQVTGVHFGPQRPGQLTSTREDAAI